MLTGPANRPAPRTPSLLDLRARPVVTGKLDAES